ncbi:UPF0764 protein C16orf89 homolog [Tenebrio molitor]|uniref:UPF0764 protein C16orf89 homolog n=1 Tax=Tenebrio molitor TaxID=7067 RepID=UPI0036246A33
MSVKSLLFFLLLPVSSFGQISQLVDKLDKSADFALEHYEEINFDGLLGFVIAEAQIVQSLRSTVDSRVLKDLKILLGKCEEIRRRIVPILPQTPTKMLVFQRYLLQPRNWITNETFAGPRLQNFGIYPDWTAADMISDKLASYKGVPSDHCLMEILALDCHVSRFCDEMMLGRRIDKGYLLSHRLFYLQIVRLKRCPYDPRAFRDSTARLCSLMLREIRTNERLGFPARDIALEQMVLCGIEGFSEFLGEKWRNEVVSWQTEFGCYGRGGGSVDKRSTNVIAYGCSDHTTGLGAAALALHLRFALQTVT